MTAAGGPCSWRGLLLLPAATFVLLAGLAACPGEIPQRGDGPLAAVDRPPPAPGDGPPPTVDARRDGQPPVADRGVPAPDKPPSGAVVPPLGGSSQGSGGGATAGAAQVTAGGVSYTLVVPGGYAPSKASRLLVVFSGTEGAAQMTQNLISLAPGYGLSDVIFAVLDGKTYFGNGQAGATALDDVRARYNVDNDRTFLLGESAGTSAALQLGFSLRQSYFAAYWANDVNASATPAKTAAQLGFAPWGNAGPGGQLAAAQAIVSGMKAAGYRLPADAPYSGPGSTQHGAVQQFMAAISFFNGKSRQ